MRYRHKFLFVQEHYYCHRKNAYLCFYKKVIFFSSTASLQILFNLSQIFSNTFQPIHCLRHKNSYFFTKTKSLLHNPGPAVKSKKQQNHKCQTNQPSHKNWKIFKHYLRIQFDRTYRLVLYFYDSLKKLGGANKEYGVYEIIHQPLTICIFL